jgi:glycosyltransferase involved in cell wall biosynthesis
VKVLHIIPTLQQGGAERLLVDLCDHASSDIEHVIITIMSETFFRPTRARVISLGVARRRGLTGIAGVIAAIPRLRRIVADERPDVVQGWLYYGNVLSLVTPRTWRIWTIHNTALAPESGHLQLFLSNRLCALACPRGVDRILYCAETARALHEAMGYSADRGVVIPNGVDAARFRIDAGQRLAVRAALRIGTDEAVLAVFARYDPQKNLPFVFEALRDAAPRIGRFRLILAGQGLDATNSELDALLNQYGLAETSLRLGATTDVHGFMHASDLILLGSAYGEALPMVLIEAALANRAIVTTDLGDVRKLGLPEDAVVRVGSREEFASAIAREVERLRTGEGAARRAEIGRAVAEAFSIERCVAAYEAVYREGGGSKQTGGVSSG